MGHRMSGASNTAAEGFQARLNRIQASQESAPQIVKTPKPKRAKASRKDMGERRKIPFGFFLTAGIGAAIVVLGNVVAFQNQFATGYFGKAAVGLGPFGLMGLALFVIMVGLGLRDKPHVIGFALAMPAMYFAEPFLAYCLPDIWIDFYSAKHVENMLIQAGLQAPPLAF